MRESGIETTVCEHAEDTGWIARKMAYAGRRGCRDRDFYGFGHVVMVEFKRNGRQLDLHQERERARLKAAGVTVHVVDDIDRGIALLDFYRANPVKALKFAPQV